MDDMEPVRGDGNQFNSPNPDAPSSPIVGKEKKGGFFSKMAKGVGEAVEKTKQGMADKRREIIPKPTMIDQPMGQPLPPSLPKPPKGVKPGRAGRSKMREMDWGHGRDAVKREKQMRSLAQAGNENAMNAMKYESQLAGYNQQMGQYERDLAKYQEQMTPEARARRVSQYSQSEASRLRNEFQKQGVDNPPSQADVLPSWGESTEGASSTPAAPNRPGRSGRPGGPRQTSVGENSPNNNAQDSEPAKPDVNPSAPSGTTKATQLKELFELHQMGGLTDEEYATAKAQVLGG